MAYLHLSQIRSHGYLKSANCLVDSRWVLKVAGFGLQALRTTNTGQDEYAYHRDLLWMAPELLRMDPQSRPIYGTQSGDVYSFAIVLQEIMFRSLPFFIGDISPKEVITKVKEPPAEGIFRPQIPKDENTAQAPHQSLVIEKMKQCWAENPTERPTFKALKLFLKKLHKGRNISIMDSMLAKLEKYSSNLEEIIAQRTSALTEEKKKTDKLLYRMLPREVAEELKRGRNVDAELYDQVTIYFSDIVDFTVLCSKSTPMQVVQLLNGLYTQFDGIIEEHNVYKVETIGDAYMLASGLPTKNARHAADIADVALQLLDATIGFRIQHLPQNRMRLRIGLHTGSCAAGVVGLTMPRYCLFGDTVNMASRMESTGEPLKIHLSESSANALKSFPQYLISERGEIEVKGKGVVTTYWLDGKKTE
ncbi:hypothetical protein CAPTEDRAFT_166938 [Capitella teleta]|uniref:Guanylate cyclase n=1 Tax=Capitella teleta TaxID=283909 RepID=R7UIL5_CAPTE|nr:hypothetical protein CAPTEDRAFT_166938 [Capitella teleta]|eukprot:ELU03633.1 hypothetical protein CAPTEDRAFT_166938 [Capitella teleta]